MDSALRGRGWANPRGIFAATALFVAALLPAPADSASGFAAVYAGESAFISLGPGQTGILTVFFQNSGTATWVRASATQVDLAACLEDKQTCNAQDLIEAPFNDGWLSSVRYATHIQQSVSPGQIATFSYRVRVPAGAAARAYRFNGDLVVSGTGERISPHGYYHDVQVVGGATGITAADCPPTSIALSPFAAFPQVGASQTLNLVATCDPIPGSVSRQVAARVSMTFSIKAVSGSNGDLTLVAETDTSGAARITYTRTGAGVEQVLAYVTSAPGVRSGTVTVTWRAAPTATAGPSPTAAGSARTFLLAPADVGSGFVTASERASPIEEQASLWNSYAPYRSAVEMLRAFGFIDSWTRYMRRDVGNGVYSVVSQATLYSTLQGASADHAANVADALAEGPFTDVAGTIGDQSRLLRRELVLTATDGTPVTVTQAYFLFRSGTAGHTLAIYAYSGQLDFSAALRWARTQATRSQSVLLPTPTPTAAPVATPIPTVTPAAPTGPTLTTRGGITFARTVSAAELQVETSVTTADAVSLRTSVDADVAHVQSALGRTFAVRPTVYIFATTSSMALGLQTIFGYPADIATLTANSATGVFLRRYKTVAVNWATARLEVPVATVRHELVHMLVNQIAGPYVDSVPAWLNEGLATAQEFTYGVSWTEVRERFKSVSMAQVGTLLSLAEMSDYYAWGQRTPPVARDQYAAAYGAVHLLQRDIGTVALVRLIERIGQGVSFSSAFTESTGQGYLVFAVTYASRLASLGGRPGVTTASDTPLGPGVHIVGFGFTPGTSVTISIRGPAGFGSTVRTADRNGVVEVFYLRTDLTPGSYSVTAVGLNGSASMIVGVSSSWTDTLSADGWMVLHDAGPEPLRDPVWLP
jgi:hypothetical protein